MPDMRQAMNSSLGGMLFLIMVSLLLCFTTAAPSTSLQSLTDRTNDIQSPRGSLRWAILLDLTRTNLISEAISSAVEKYSSEIANASEDSLFAGKLTILDSNGSSATALSKVYDLISDGSKLPDVLFLAETNEVSLLALDMLRSSEATANILVILIGSSDKTLCNPILNPRLVCIVPHDTTNFRGILEVASISLRWESVAVIVSSSKHSIHFQKIASTQLQGMRYAPTIVGEAFMSSVSSQAEDDALLANLILHKPKGIVCFVDEKQLKRLQTAVQRANLDVFLLGNQEALGALRQMNGTYQPYVKPYGALFVSTYETAEGLVSKGYFEKDGVDEYGAYIMSHLFDGMRVVTEARGVDNMSALNAVRFVGFTGTVAFSPLRSERVETSFSIILDHYPMPNPLVTWESGNYTSESFIKKF